MGGIDPAGYLESYLRPMRRAVYQRMSVLQVPLQGNIGVISAAVAKFVLGVLNVKTLCRVMRLCSDENNLHKQVSLVLLYGLISAVQNLKS